MGTTAPRLTAATVLYALAAFSGLAEAQAPTAPPRLPEAVAPRLQVQPEAVPGQQAPGQAAPGAEAAPAPNGEGPGRLQSCPDPGRRLELIV